MDFNTQSNVQQNPDYQRQQSRMYAQQSPNPQQRESFLDRQMRVYGGPAPNPPQQRQTLAPTSQAAGVTQQSNPGTPVASNGKISPSPAPQPPAPGAAAMAPVSTPATAGAPPQYGQTMLSYGAGQPQFYQRPQATQFQGYDLGNQPLAQYQGAQFNEQIPQTYQAKDIAPNYQTQQFSQFQAPQQQQLSDQQNQLMSSMLQNPLSMSDQNVHQLNAQQREAALALEKQTGQQLDQRAASMGRLNGGMNTGLQHQLAADTNAKILEGQRATALQKMQQDRADQLGVLDASNSMLTGQMARASEGYKNALMGQQANDASQQFGANLGLQSGIANQQNQQAQGAQALQGRTLQQQIAEANAGEQWKAYQAANAADQLALQRGQAQAGINQQAANSALQGYGMDTDLWNSQQNRQLQDMLGTGALNLDNLRYGENQRQFNTSTALDALRFIESQRQFNENMGFNYNQLGQQGQNTLLNFLMGL